MLYTDVIRSNLSLSRFKLCFEYPRYRSLFNFKGEQCRFASIYITILREMHSRMHYGIFWKEAILSRKVTRRINIRLYSEVLSSLSRSHSPEWIEFQKHAELKDSNAQRLEEIAGRRMRSKFERGRVTQKPRLIRNSRS